MDGISLKYVRKKFQLILNGISSYVYIRWIKYIDGFEEIFIKIIEKTFQWYSYYVIFR